MKRSAYKNNLHTVDKLKNNITEFINAIILLVLQRVFSDMLKRLQEYVKTNESYIDQQFSVVTTIVIT